MDNKDKVLDILKKYTAVCKADITEKSEIYGDLAISSIKFYLMILDIESSFNIKFENVLIGSPEFNTVGSLIQHIIKVRCDKNE